MTFYGTRYTKTIPEIGTQTDDVPDVLPRKLAATTGRNKWSYIEASA